MKPVLLRSAEARYTADARRANIEGEVEVDVVVLTNGTVGGARVVKSLDTVFRLDQEALRAARTWLYLPGTLNGTPVPVVTCVKVPFVL